MKTTRCPLCASDVIIEDEAYEGDLLDCANCGSELEISSLHPIRLTKIGEAKSPDENDAETDTNLN